LASFAQTKDYSSSAILQDLKKLNVLGSVLYVAAHPDDENTAIIAYYANEELFRAGYLSATRGDGGQNLVGPEIREQLGIIRTQELLAARRTDGGEQMFSRANDFGYSKNPEETFKMWDKQEILSDFVWAFRKFRPDVIITRFDDQPPNHGHHTASAILAREAFKLSGDKNAFPEQLKYVEPWQPKRIYWNTHPFFFQRRGVAFDTANYGQVPIGKYNAVLGKSYTEISAVSRSMHKSQGFGSTGSRGERNDYLTQWEGSESLQPFDGIDTTWERVIGGKKVKPIIEAAIVSFDPLNPSASLADLLKIKAAIADNVKDEFWKKVKLAEVDKLMLSVTGTFLEVSADDYSYTPGDSIVLRLEAVNRSSQPLKLIAVEGLGVSTSIDAELSDNKRINTTWKAVIKKEQPYSNPYWLEEEGTLGRYEVKEQLLRGLPENPPVYKATVTL
ncbi:MAG: PIG-L family deacetylase, partial [Cyclobacteriaceae bacterium]